MLSLLAKMTITKRVVLCLLISIVPMSLVAAYFIANGIQKDVATAKLEQAGNLYQRPLEALLQHVAEHGRITTDAEFDASKELSEAGVIDSAFTELDRVQQSSGSDLQVTPEGLSSRRRERFAPEKIKAEWQSLRTAQGSLSVEDRHAKHLELIADIRGLISHIGDTSGLILDPDLDSYYLMDSTLLALPQTQDRIASIREAYRVRARQKNISQQDRDQMAVESAMLKQSDVDHVSGDIDTAFKEDANFNGISPTLRQRVEPAYKSYLSANNQALDQMAAFAKSGNPKQLPSLDGALTQALESSFDLWRTASEELDTLLALRIVDRHAALLHGLAGMLVAILVPGLFAWLILRRLRGDLLEVTGRLHESSLELIQLGDTSAGQSQALASGASEQAASLEQTSASSHEINSMTKSNAEQSHSAASQMAAVDQKIAGLQKDLNEFTGRMTEITSSSERIASIIKVIHEISFQTNILALNAAVEAARAGEAGMGFAVVADEVRNLAQRCASAATDTERLITESVQKAKNGQAQLSRTFANIGDIVETTKSASHLLTQIQQASQEQVRGVEEISRALTQIEVVTQQTASSAEKGTHTSSELRRNAEVLTEIVGSLSSLITRN